jgi:hypothetical protein
MKTMSGSLALSQQKIKTKREKLEQHHSLRELQLHLKEKKQRGEVKEPKEEEVDPYPYCYG